MLIELLTDIDLLSDADNDPLVLIESLTIYEVLIASDELVDFESLVLNDIDVLCESDLLVDAL